MDIALSIFVTVLLTLVNGYFSMSEMALSTAKKVMLDHDAEQGDKAAARAARVIENPTGFLAAIQVAITLVGFFSSAFAATSLSAPLGAWLASLGADPAFAGGLATVLITLVVSYFSIVVGELVPKRIAMAEAEKVSKSVAGPLSAFAHFVRPLVALTSASANGLACALGIKSADDRQDVSEDEIRYMVTDSDELSDEEKTMIHEIFDLGDAKAREVMIPRVDLTALEDTSTLSEVLDVMRSTGFSRIPIFHDDVDRIVGIAHIKDLIGPMVDLGEGDKPISRYMRSADFVPDTKDIIPLLSEMQNSRDQMVIVVDEYGGTAGVITIEDIVEEVVGEIADEFDPDNKYLTQLSDREWLVDGRFSIDDAIELGWPIEDSEEYETVAGFVLEIADGLPKPGEVFEVEGYRFRVQSMRGRRLALLRVTAPEPPADAADEEETAE
ncbi:MULTISPECIES: hemolysin family protein [Atopobiaceae]|uniref:Hemolysin n=1 Tax=Parafannyhessea umbonata TaxID=604330 RepID=A0A1H6ING6_9ACTN|nr:MULTISPECIES: hemolysin family protein [Atopobiaceae]SEH48569.1 putative hemolysin [Parafannyhessea umbonata]SJZ67193.1 putative hemolysin [Olsenella sp. KH1P3]